MEMSMIMEIEDFINFLLKKLSTWKKLFTNNSDLLGNEDK